MLPRDDISHADVIEREEDLKRKNKVKRMESAYARAIKYIGTARTYRREEYV